MSAKSQSLPPNVRVSKHPCIQAKLSQLRSKATTAKETKQLVHDIAVILGVEALTELPLVDAGQVSILLSFCFTRSIGFHYIAA